MDGVRLQARRLRELQDYIDAQHGGPGKGWFRIVTDPFEARRQINAGKLAVVMGIEVSKLFDCGVQDGRPECTAEQIDQRLKEVYDLGVRDMELVNKFDNALGGVAGDSGTTGVVVNVGNRIETGRFWQMETVRGRAQPRPRAAHRAGGAGSRPARREPPPCPAAARRRAALRPAAALQRARSVAARRAPRDADDGRGDGHRPRPPQRARPPAAARRGRAARLLRRRVEPQLEHAGRDPADPAARRRRHADGGLHHRLRGRLARDEGAARPALLLGHRLGRRHERLRLPGRPARGRQRHATRSARSTARPSTASAAASASTTSTSTGSPTTACSRTGSRTCDCSPARTIVDDLGPRRRGVPPDVGARGRRAGHALRASRPGHASRPRERPAAGAVDRLAAPRRPAAPARRDGPGSGATSPRGSPPGRVVQRAEHGAGAPRARREARQAPRRGHAPPHPPRRAGRSRRAARSASACGAVGCSGSAPRPCASRARRTSTAAG